MVSPVSRPTPGKAALVFLAAALTACGSSQDSSGPSTNTGPQAFAPSRDTTLTGTVQFTTFNVPSGVTVTATGALTINASGSVQIAGTLKAPCFPLSVLGAKSVTITGTVSTACASPGAVPPTLLILGDSGYTLSGSIVASGPWNITTDTTLTDAGFPQNSVATLSRARAMSSTATGATSASSLAGGFCTVFNATFTADPAAAPNGADGNPVGGNGQDGSAWTLACTGELDIEGGVTVTGQSGGNGGTGTSTSAATATGGNGGKAGTLKVRSAGPMVISGGTFASGNGGNGGGGNANPTTQGTAATAIGGKGGDATGGSGANGPVDIRAKGSITISGTTSIVVGHAGNGGAASAKGVDGQSGQTGSAATATGGNGGSSSPYGLAGTNVGIASVTVSGGNGGTGGKATASAGNGGPTGGSGGPNGAIGGNGGNAQVKDQNGNLVGNGGDAGSLEFDNANGAAGANGCPNAGQAGGGGGSASGHTGTPGTGVKPGAQGTAVFNSTGNGADGGNGNGPGAGGPAGADGTTAPTKTATGTNFKPGKPGAACPPPATTVQIVNGDTSDAPWDSVQVSVNGGPLTKATKSGTTYTIDLTNVASTSIVRIVVSFTALTTKHIAVFDGPAAWFLAMANNPNCVVTGSAIARARSAQAQVVNCPLPIAMKFWGTPTGRVTYTDNGLTGQAMIREGDYLGTANATANSGSLSALLGIPTGISQAVTSASGLTTGVSAGVLTLTNNQDISTTLNPTVAPQNTGVTIPPGSIGGPTWTAHGVDAIDYRVVPRLTLLDHWRLYDVGFFSKQLATPNTFAFPTVPAASMPSAGALQWIETTMWMTPTTWLGEVAHARSFGPTHAVTFASAYNAPTISTQSGPSGMSFTIAGQYSVGYVSGEFHSSTVLPSGVIYIIDAYNYQPSGGAYNIVLPPIPIGGSGSYLYEAGTNDAFSLPNDGGVYWRAGYKGYLGTPPTQSITVNGPSSAVSLVHGGGCATASVSVVTVGQTLPAFVGYVQTAGAAGSVTVTPPNSVIQAGSGGTTPITHGIPITICSSLGSTAGGTANVQVNVASIGAAALIEGVGNIQIVFN